MYNDKAYHQYYYQANKEKLKANSRAYGEAHKEQRLAYGKEWRKKHPDYYKRYATKDLFKMGTKE